MTTMKTLYSWYLTVRTFLHTCWVLINGWFWTDTFTSTGKFRKKILVIGDDHAAGLGDWIICTQTAGVPKYLASEIQEGQHVRFKWLCCGAGHMKSTSADWLPTASKPAFMPWSIKKNLFTTVFETGPHRDCSVVVIMLGSNDPGCDSEHTSKNVMTLAKELVGRGKRVFICTMPNKGYLEAGKARKGWVITERNTEIKKAIEKHGDKHLLLGADLESFKRQELFSFTGKHFGSKGYKKLARDLYSLMKNPLINVEWLSAQPEIQKMLDERAAAAEKLMKEKGLKVQ
eukprot:TRINITY_DN11456_c0_g1_i1.p1 TRINITY_DN11456_c0_g1~~TRINITY_DN11456_c0_g1_i1.p1  ORF type:complete len:307 (+),score=44.47 TRINITY_DN11456_c0_g1_i1:61-921(+)